jgi:hypothetical protein
MECTLEKLKLAACTQANFTCQVRKDLGLHNMITRQDYLNDSENLHRQYFGQFVNDKVKEHLLNNISKEELLKSKDKHLNDIALDRWDALGGFKFSKTTGAILMKPQSNLDILPLDYKLIVEAGDGISSSLVVCVYKEAARQIIEESK